MELLGYRPASEGWEILMSLTVPSIGGQGSRPPLTLSETTDHTLTTASSRKEASNLALHWHKNGSPRILLRLYTG